MRISHHPCPESLMSCSGGAMPEAFAAVMASHIEMCATCRAEMKFLEQVGAVMLESLPPARVSSPAPVMGLRASEADHDQDNAAAVQLAGDVPGPLVAAVGYNLDSLLWILVQPGVWQHEIALKGQNRGQLSLVKVAPGHELSEQMCSGAAITMVLKGSYAGATGRYQAGDVADHGEVVTPAPVVDSDDGCICLVASVA